MIIQACILSALIVLLALLPSKDLSMKQLLRTTAKVSIACIFLIFLKYYNQKAMIFTIFFIGIVLILILNIIIGIKQRKKPFPEQHFCRIAKDALPETFWNYLLMNNIKVRILYYNSNYINSHLIQRAYCNYIIFTSAALEKLNISEVNALIFHEIGHIMGHHSWKNRFYCNIKNAACMVLFGICLNIYIELDLSVIQALTLCCICLEIFYYFSRLLQCWLQRNQEFEADKFAVHHIGVKALTNALNKTNKAFIKNIFSKHPDVSERIKRISHYE